MKNFKDFISEEKPNIKRKAKGEQDFVDAHEVEVTDPENSGTEGPAKVTTKAGSGKRKADKDNKQEFGEEVEEIDELDTSTLASYREKTKDDVKKGKKTVNRMMGQMRADVRLIGRSLGKKPFEKYTKEETELTEEEILALDEAKVDRGLSDEDKVAARAARGQISRAVNPGNTSGGQFRGKGPSPYKNAFVAKQGPRKGMIVQTAIDRTKDKIKSRLNMEEAELDEAETPFTSDKPKKNPPAVAGKYGQGPSTAKHLAKQGMQKTLRQMKKSKNMQEADFSKKETKMAHTIGKEFEKKGVGDESKGGPYAVASAMVRDKPEAAEKAYKTIQSKMKEEADAELLFNLYNDLNEENQEMFMSQLEEDADSLLEFARMMEEE